MLVPLATDTPSGSKTLTTATSWIEPGTRQTVVAMLVLIGLLTFLWLPVVLQELRVPGGGQTVRRQDSPWLELSPTIAVLLGAGFFSLHNLFGRHMRTDRRPSAYSGATQASCSPPSAPGSSTASSSSSAWPTTERARTGAR